MELRSLKSLVLTLLVFLLIVFIILPTIFSSDYDIDRFTSEKPPMTPDFTIKPEATAITDEQWKIARKFGKEIHGWNEGQMAGHAGTPEKTIKQLNECDNIEDMKYFRIQLNDWILKNYPIVPDYTIKPGTVTLSNTQLERAQTWVITNYKWNDTNINKYFGTPEKTANQFTEWDDAGHQRLRDQFNDWVKKNPPPLSPEEEAKLKAEKKAKREAVIAEIAKKEATKIMGEVETKLLSEAEKKVSNNYYTKSEIDSRQYANTSNVAKSIMDSEDKIIKHTHDDLTEIQKKYVDDQMAPVFSNIADIKSTSQINTGRLDVADKARDAIIAMIKEEVPRYAQNYINAENKKQHDSIIKHVESTINNMNAVTTANLNNLREGVINHIHDKGIELERKIKDATTKQLSQTLQVSKALSETAVAHHDLIAKH